VGLGRQPVLELASRGWRQPAQAEHGRGLARVVARDGLDCEPWVCLGLERRADVVGAEPQGAHVRQHSGFAEHPPEQALGERREGMVLHHAAAGPVHHGDIAAACGLEETWNAGEPGAWQMERVHHVARLLGEDEIDPLQPVQRLQVDLVVPHGEIAALDHRVAEIAGEIGVAEIGRTRRAGAQDHDPAVVAPAQALEALLQAEKMTGEPACAAIAEQLGETVAQGHAAREHVAVADRGVGLVPQDHPLA
jgi:hypothetical protein